MNIIIVGKFTEEQFGFHIADALQELNHNVFSYDPSLPVKYYKTKLFRRMHQFNGVLFNNLMITSSFRNYKRQQLYQILSNNKIDLIICTHDFLFADEIQRIKIISKTKVAMWFPDAVANLGKSSFIIADYDAIFFKDPYIVKVLREQYNKKNIYYLPECCNPKYHKRVDLSSDDHKIFDCDLSTYGSAHNFRSAFFEQLLNKNYTIKIWGHHPPIWLKDDLIRSLYTGKYVFNETKSKSVLAAKININTLHPSEIFGLNTRAFEVAGIGGFQIIHRRPGLKYLFKEDSEIVAFENFEELTKKVDYYLANDDARNQIAKNGQIRAYKEHTFAQRLRLLIETIEGKSKGYQIPESINNNII